MQTLNESSNGNGILHENISTVARGLWEQAGRPSGRDEEFWFTAEAQVTGRGGARADTTGVSLRPPARRSAPRASTHAPTPVEPLSGTRKKEARASR